MNLHGKTQQFKGTKSSLIDALHTIYCALLFVFDDNYITDRLDYDVLRNCRNYG